MAITSAKIAAAAVGAEKLEPGAVTETKIADDAVSTPKIQANAVSADQIAANAVVAAKIAADAVTAAKIAAGAVETDKLAANAVTADKIAANTITADELAATLIVSNLFATAATGQRVEFDTDGIRLLDSSDNVLVNLPTDSLETPEFVGKVLAGGLDLFAGTGSAPDATRRVRWLDDSSEDPIAHMYAYDTGSLARVVIEPEPDLGYASHASLSALSAAIGTPNADVSATSDPGSTGSRATMQVGSGGRVVADEDTVHALVAGANEVTVTNDSGESSFLQLLTAADVKIDFGSRTFTGVASPVTNASVSHSLGRTPTVAYAIVDTSESTVTAANRLIANVANLTSTDFDIFVRRNDDSNIGSGNVTCYWLAIG